MTLHQLLSKIANGQTLNFDQVVKKLPSNVNWQVIFSAELVSKNKHIVRIKDEVEFLRLLEEAKVPQSRQEAARHALLSSHAVKCDSAYMLCFPCNNTTAGSREITVVTTMKSSLLNLPFKVAKHAILIENQDCFFQWPAFLALFAKSVSVADADIYFSAGKRILNRAFLPLLCEYEHIHCIFDYDLAGLEIAEHLSIQIANAKQSKTHTKQGQTHLSFALPDNLKSMASLFTALAKSTQDLNKMLALTNKWELHELREIISKQARFMEQEALLL